MMLNKNKIKYFLFGILSIIFFEFIIGLVLIILYINGYFNIKSSISKGEQWDSSILFSGINEQIIIKNITGLDYKKIIKNENNLYKISYLKTQKDVKQIQINKYILDFMIVKKYFQNNNIDLDNFLISYYNLKGFIFDIKDFVRYLLNVEGVSLNKQDFFDYYSKGVKEYLDKINNEDFEKLNKYYEDIYQEYTKFINNYKNKQLKSCYYYFCNDEKEIYDYLKNAVIYDTGLNISIDEISKKYNINSKIFYTTLLIENIRMNTTFRGEFKKLLLSLKTPILPIMSQFSYGLYGIKLKNITTIVNCYKDPSSVFYIGENQFLESLINKFYSQDSKGNYYISDENGLINYIIENKVVQTELLAIYIFMQIKAWGDIGIDLNENPGVLFTLYNIGSFKKPHNNPQFGGAIINIGNNQYNFGKLGEIMFYSLELENIIKNIKMN